jgi:hypothetical protein
MPRTLSSWEVAIVSAKGSTSHHRTAYKRHETGGRVQALIHDGTVLASVSYPMNCHFGYLMFGTHVFAIPLATEFSR